MSDLKYQTTEYLLHQRKFTQLRYHAEVAHIADKLSKGLKPGRYDYQNKNTWLMRRQAIENELTRRDINVRE